MRRGLMAAALLAAGCAAEQPRLASTLPAKPAARPSYVGAETASVPPDAVEQEMAMVERELAGCARALPPALHAAVAALPAHALALRLEADASFPPGSAQLEAAALADYAAIAQWLAPRSTLVAHVLVFASEPGAPPTGLAARRAAALLDYFESRGVPGVRLRAEGREAAEPRVVLVLVPVVLGREAEAWMRPPQA